MISKYQKILIIGSGRWANEISKELRNIYRNKKNIFILNNGKKNIIKFIQNYKFLELNNLKEIDKYKITHVIICNSSKDHYKYFFQLKKFKVKILIEKPISINYFTNRKIYNYSKKNPNKIFYSSQFYFSEFFMSVNKFLIKKKIKLESLEFIWHDKKNEIRNKVIKKQNLDISYGEDIFYHFFSIFNSINRNYKKGVVRKLQYSKSKIIFYLNNILIELDINRNSNKRIRKIKIKKNFSKTLLSINFSKFPYLKFKNIQKNYHKKDQCLLNQLKSFLSINNKFNLNNIKLANNKILISNLKKFSN